MAAPMFDPRRRRRPTTPPTPGTPPGQTSVDQVQEGRNASVRDMANANYRNALLRRAQGGGAPNTASAQGAPTGDVMDALQARLRTRTSRRVLQGRGT